MKLLLDEHMPLALSPALAGKTTHEVASLQAWQGGAFLHAKDHEILRAAYADGWTLVTYDVRSIPTLLRLWMVQGIPHAGVILIDDHTIAQRDIGGQLRALLKLLTRSGHEDRENRVDYLRP
ncbi:MAG TPA: DUF5615 family PIN-like protein [Ktedonobacterales bacterium]